MKNSLLYSLLLVILLWASVYAAPFGPQDGSNHWFKQPTKENPTPHDSRLKEVLYRADRPRVLVRNRYYPEISGREYIDCAAFKYVDCSNLTFCRCWQCRFYRYNFVYD